MRLKAVNPVVLGTFLVTLLNSISSLADQPVGKDSPVSNQALASPSYAYAPGTFSIKPLNANIANFTFGRRPDDSKLMVNGRNNIVGQYFPFTANIDAYRDQLSLGFAESDRNGFGYGVELGYVLGKDTEILGRVGYCRERAVSRFLIGDRSFNFESRNNWGMSFGARRYINIDSPWKPFVVGDAGFTVQGATIATINRHNPNNGSRNIYDTPIQTSTLLKRKTLFTGEFGGGVDYLFNKTWALSFSVALRYSQQGGMNTVSTPADTSPFVSPAMPVFYKDNKPQWSVPFTLSLKIIV